MNIIDKYKIDSLPPKLYEQNLQTKGNFSQILANKFSELVSSINKSEKLSLQAASNKVDIHTLATNLSIAEVNLRSFMKIHEQLLSTLQEISKMQI